ncbi:MAG: TonB-dependent siderophore receptor [Burkholderiaceae bacterium]
MPHTASRIQPTAISLAVLLALALPTPQLHAQAALPQTARHYAISAGPLEEVLTRFTATAGIALSFDPALVAGLRSVGLNGSYTDEQGLQRILQGSGLEMVAQPAGGYSLRKSARAAAGSAAQQEAPTLPAVAVMARAERSDLTEGTGSYTTRGTSAATGVNLSLRETPQSVSVITRERMDEQGLNSLREALSEVTGVHGEAAGTQVGGYIGISARGYTINSYLVDGLNIYADGYNVHSFDTAVYDSITVVRGATGLLTGSGDPGASVHLTRKRPTSDFQASLSQGLGRWNQRRTVADVAGPLNRAGTLRGRLVVAYDEGKSWVDRYRNNKSVVYGVLEADLGDRTLLTLALEHGRTSGRGAGSENGFSLTFGDGSAVPSSRSDSALADWSRFTTERTMLDAKIEHRFNENWRGQLSYGHGRTDVFGSRGVAYVGADANADMSLFLRNWSTRKPVRVNDLVGKLEGRYELFGRKNDLVVGFNARDFTDVSDGGGWTTPTVPWSQWNGHVPPVDPADPGVNTDFVEDYSTKIEQAGLFAVTRLRPADGLSVILGGRWSYWKTRTEQFPNSSSYDPNNPISDERKESGVFTPYAGVVYDLRENLSAYASYTEIFNPQSSRDASGKVLDPEQGKNTELGLKGSWLDGRLNASAAVFEVRKDNLAVLDGDKRTPTGDLAYVAQDSTKGRGWELEVSGQLARGWQMQAGYTRVVTRDSDGARLNGHMPAHMFKLFSSYRMPSVPGLTLGGGVVWQSKVYAFWMDESLQSINTQKSYAVANLMARYAIDRHWSLALNLNNVFDKHYRTATRDHQYGAPRNLYATLKYQF